MRPAQTDRRNHPLRVAPVRRARATRPQPGDHPVRRVRRCHAARVRRARAVGRAIGRIARRVRRCHAARVRRARAVALTIALIVRPARRVRRCHAARVQRRARVALGRTIGLFARRVRRVRRCHAARVRRRARVAQGRTIGLIVRPARPTHRPCVARVQPSAPAVALAHVRAAPGGLRRSARQLAMRPGRCMWFRPSPAWATWPGQR
jgi:hypothetical protein